MERPLRILHAEDNPGDAQLTRLALDEGETPVDLHHVLDGEQALQFLRREGEYAGVPRPDLVLLDLNMPRLSGHETLVAIKDDPALRSIPILVLTTSNTPSDVERSYDAHANSYLRKPISYSQLVQLMRRVEQFWLGAAVLPSLAADDQ
jgi:two-component system, chemotaxis family, response regulator Rcp1